MTKRTKGPLETAANQFTWIFLPLMFGSIIAFAFWQSGKTFESTEDFVARNIQELSCYDQTSNWVALSVCLRDGIVLNENGDWVQVDTTRIEELATMSVTEILEGDTV